MKIPLIDWQQKVYNNRRRFTVISAGRQSGKTHLCVYLIIEAAATHQGWICWWVAPIYDNVRIAFRRCVQFLVENGIKYEANKSGPNITIGTSVIQFKSADREEGLRGESVNYMVIDEMGLIKRDAWEYALRGTIAATKASVVFIGTPKGKNLFYELYNNGLDRLKKDWISYQVESRESPYFGKEEWKNVKQLPTRIFQQEYQAVFVDDGGEVFRGIRECIKGALQNPNQHKRYFMGVDLAKSFDYSVIIILNDSGHIVHFDRFNSIAWSVQKARIVDAARRYNAALALDSTGVGDPILEDLQRSGIAVEGVKFTNTNKRQMVEALAMAIERGEVSFPDIPELINELSVFTFEQLPSGNIRYAAPEGLHDDIVIAFALAYYKHGGTTGWIDSFGTTENYEAGTENFFEDI